MIKLQIPDIAPALPDSVPSVGSELSMLRSLPVDELIQRLVSSTVTFAINLAIAIVVFYVGRIVVKRIYKFISNIFVKRNLDRSLATFVLSMVQIVLYFILIVTVIGILGIETSSFIALFASAGVAIGMALSGTLQNFAGGVLILLLKPYKIGDYIEAQGYAGTVREIQIFHTIISTPDNKSIIIPNGGLSTGSINNYSREDYRRVDWVVGISYGNNVDTARTKVLELLAADPRVVKTTVEDHRAENAVQDEALEECTDPTHQHCHSAEEPVKGWKRFFFKQKEKISHAAESHLPSPSAVFSQPVDRSPRVYVAQLAASSVDLKITAWVPTGVYWDVFYDINEKIYKTLEGPDIAFPFPQLDVHMK